MVIQKRIKFAVILLFILFLTINGHAEKVKIPLKTEYFRIEKAEIYRSFLSYKCVIEKRGKNAYIILSDNSHLPELERLRGCEIKSKENIEEKKIVTLIKILNYVNFMELPNSIRNNRVGMGSYPDLVFNLYFKNNNGRIVHKNITCHLFEFKKSTQEEMMRIAFLDLYIDSISNFRARYWR